MEVKKSPKANLERNRSLFFFMGLVVAFSIVYFALEWRSTNKDEAIARNGLDIADIEDAMLIQDTQEPEPPEPEAVPEQAIEVALPEEFKVVDDDKQVAKVVLISADERKELPPPAPIIAAPVEDEAEDKIFEIVEEQPVPPGGSQEAMLKWIQRNLRYPEIAADNGIQGRVVVQFVVERDGSVTAVSVVRGVDPSLDKEAVRVISKMDKWKPGRQRGKPVRSRFTAQVIFKLNQ